MSQQLVIQLASIILEHKRDLPLRVGIDGIDAAGKTILAERIASCLTKNGHPVIRASIDGFHNPSIIRHQRGSYSPEGYYYDSFNYELLKSCLLEPLEPEGNKVCSLKVFDFKTDTEIHADEIKATNASILLFDGVFLFRREIEKYWDLKIFVDVDFQTNLMRALERDGYLFSDENEILRKYQERYIPGQRIYLEAEKPMLKADIVVDNNDYLKPFIENHGGASIYSRSQSEFLT